MYSGVLWAWATMSAVPTSFYTFKTIFHVLWGIYESVGGAGLTGLFPPSVVNTPFLQIRSFVWVWLLLI